MNLTEMLARARQDLQDTDPTNYRWTDDAIQGAIHRAVYEYSLYAPREQQTDIPTDPGSTELDISTLSGLLKIESIEFPIGEEPRSLQDFEYYAGILNMEDEGDGTNARVRWLAIHVVSPSSSTIPPEHDEIIILGATGYLAMSASAHIVDRATISGRHGTVNYKLWGQERLQRYDSMLSRIAKKPIAAPPTQPGQPPSEPPPAPGPLVTRKLILDDDDD